MVDQVIGRLPSGCSILTASYDGAETATLVSWIQQAALEPLHVSVAIRNGRPIESLISQSGKFVLNLVASESSGALFKHFGRGFALDEDAFSGIKVRRSSGGIILEDALGYAECAVADRVVVADHTLFVGQVIAGQLQSDSAPYVHIRKSAKKY